ncbi:hypothetical protein B0F90DRAFT_1718863 [Multifurca ochricompacta]|uniref:Large ribosomal subunit protein mL59 domain-containing protein n=1 Tax=Multifurca ochricompacta TaxID=376703 RepID=A0AAD4M6N2_9AGAM|nr:hypothetical protein B0F90DRAFT_1718863 [Multifurca ochricompacta]
MSSSHSLRAVKRFRLRELLSHQSLVSSSSIAADSKRPQRLAPELSQGGTLPNPFIPHKNPESGRWAPPKYSLRRQAELIKHALASGTIHLLPPGPKLSPAQLAAIASDASSATTNKPAEGRASESSSGLTDIQQAQGQGSEDAGWTGPVEWAGTVRERSVAGADIGNRLYAGKKRMFKGHKWERMRERRVIRTKILLRDMDKRVQRFKGYRTKGKPLPLARRSNVLKKTQKLPF